MSKALHYNRPQLRAMTVDAQNYYGVHGRGTGKTHGILSPFFLRRAHQMPQGCGALVGATFAQLLTRLLPEIVAGWEAMGYRRDEHFVIGKRFPKNWNIKNPFLSPYKYDYFIQWYNGSGIHLISQDREGSSNGLSLDFIGGDECKFLNKEKLDTELRPTVRANRAVFGDLPWHLGEWFTTDQPMNKKGQWIWEMEKGMDKEQIDLIFQIQVELMKLKQSKHAATGKQIRHYEKLLHKLRKGSVYYDEASSLENIEILGEDYIKNQERNLPSLVFMSSILNKRIRNLEGDFYAYLSEAKHGYFAHNYSHLDGLDYDFKKLQSVDCRFDMDLNKYQPIDLAFDYGARINTLACGQLNSDSNEYKVLNAMFVKQPELLQDLTQQFCNYYEHMPCKVVNYYYDHTAIAKTATNGISYADEVIRILQENGWQVNQIYIGQAPPHKEKYLLWGRLLQEEDPRLPKFRYNKSNCEYLIISMENAKLKNSGDGFKKDKSSEGHADHITPAEESTHFSDAGDTLIWANVHHRFTGNLSGSGDSGITL